MKKLPSFGPAVVCANGYKEWYNKNGELYKIEHSDGTIEYLYFVEKFNNRLKEIHNNYKNI